MAVARSPERESQLFHILREGPASLVNTPSDYQDLTFDKLLVYYAAKGVQLPRRTFKKNLRLLCDDGRYNMLAQLLSDDSHIPVRFAMFNGPDKTSAMYAVREFGNTCLLYSLDKALEYGDLLNVPRGDEAFEAVAGKILALCVEPKGIREIAAALGLKDKKSVRRYLRPLLDQGRLAMTIPNAPTSRLQKYIAVR